MIRFGTLDLELELYNIKTLKFTLDIYCVVDTHNKKMRLAISLDKITERWEEIQRNLKKSHACYLAYYSLHSTHFWINSFFECISRALDYRNYPNMVYFQGNGNTKKYIWSSYYTSIKELSDFMEDTHKDLKLYRHDNYVIDEVGVIRIKNKKLDRDFHTKIMGKLI